MTLTSSTRRVRCAVATAAALVAISAVPVRARQDAAAPRSFQLIDLQNAAVVSDPRTRELTLDAQAADLRLRNIAAGRLPALSVAGETQYQSDVPRVPLTLPNGQPLFSPPKTTYDASLRVDQTIFDATIGAQASLERAERDEAESRVTAAIFARRQQVNDAFFAAASLQERARALDATIDDLQARLTETTARVQNGDALPADAAIVEATLLERREDADELRADRHAALATLSTLTGTTVTDADDLVVPDLSAAVRTARAAPAPVTLRPEFATFARTRDRLDRQAAVAGAQNAPRIAVFAKAGYGKPGLNFISDAFESYGLAGVQVQWRAWTWGTAGREEDALALDRQTVDAEEAAFARTLDATTQDDLATIDRLRQTVATDDRIITLREEVTRSMQARLTEGVVTAADYLDRDAELLQARLTRAGHSVALSEASARLLTTLGLEVR